MSVSKSIGFSGTSTAVAPIAVGDILVHSSLVFCYIGARLLLSKAFIITIVAGRHCFIADFIFKYICSFIILFYKGCNFRAIAIISVAELDRKNFLHILCLKSKNGEQFYEKIRRLSTNPERFSHIS